MDFGDVNVLTAIDWARNVFADKLGSYPHEVIQVVRKADPADAPYRTPSGIVVIETAGLPEFFTEYKTTTKSLRERRKQEKILLRELATTFDTAEAADVTRFLDDAAWRKEAFKVLTRFSANVVEQFEGFFEKCLDETKRRAQPTGAFGAYATTMHLLSDFLTSFDCKDLPPTLVYVAVQSFNRLAPYVGNSYGQSWAAQEAWQARKGELQAETLQELRTVAKQYRAASLKLLLDE